MTADESADELSAYLSRNSELLEKLILQTAEIKDRLCSTETRGSSSATESLKLKKPQATTVDLDRVQKLESRCTELEQENADLVRTLQLIMAKYRMQAKQMQSERSRIKMNLEQLLAEERGVSDSLRKENLLLQERVHEMMKVLREAASVEQDELEYQSLVEQLAKENEGLKQMLAISEQVIPETENDIL